MKTLKGLYAITPERPAAAPPLVEQVRLAIAGGARLIQYRDKGSDAAKRLREAYALLGVCRESGVALLVNDDLELAVRIGADGVHLGRDDADPREARARLGPEAIIGVSCYDRIERAHEAREMGANYAAFGRFFPSATKPGAAQAHPDLLRRARGEVGLPLVAIGGITAENGGSLIAAGADMLAVIDALFRAADIRAAARALSRLFPMEVPAHDPLP